MTFWPTGSIVRRGPARFLISLRDDFLHVLERYRGRMPALMDNRFELRLLTGPQALEAVIEPGRVRRRPAEISRLSSPRRPVARLSGS